MKELKKRTVYKYGEYITPSELFGGVELDIEADNTFRVKMYDCFLSGLYSWKIRKILRRKA